MMLISLLESVIAVDVFQIQNFITIATFAIIGEYGLLSMKYAGVDGQTFLILGKVNINEASSISRESITSIAYYNFYQSSTKSTKLYKKMYRYNLGNE